MKRNDIKDRLKYGNISFLDSHVDRRCIYYDSEMRKLSDAFTAMSHVFKDIKNRYDRADSIVTARSQFDYLSRREIVLESPQILYRCVYDNKQTFIQKYRGVYYVVTDNWIMDDKSFYAYSKLYKNKYLTMFEMPDFNTARRVYSEMSRMMLCQIHGDLF